MGRAQTPSIKDRSPAPTRAVRTAVGATALFAVAAAAVIGVSSATANHIAGATYNGTITGAGSLSFTVSGNGSEITYLSTPGPIPGDTCTFGNLSGSYSAPITNHKFNESSRSVYFSGSFGGKQSASGTFRISFSDCDTGYLSWNATTTASPPITKCKGKTATIVAHPGLARKLTGTNGKDVIVGSSKNDTINAKGGNDTVCGKGGNDTLKGGGGKDKLYGQGGNDTCVGGGGNDSANCETEKSI